VGEINLDGFPFLHTHAGLISVSYGQRVCVLH